MPIKMRSVSIIFSKAEYLQRFGHEYTLKGINGRYELRSPYFGDDVYVSSFNEKLPAKDLNFIKKVKNHVKKNCVYMPKMKYLDSSMIEYVHIEKKDPCELNNQIYEVDIDEAYWRAAYKLDVISKDLYDAAKKESGVDKKVRLIALGSLAKKEYTYTFIGKRIIRKHETESYLTQNYWYNICNYISEVMQGCREIIKNDYIMFWVDGIYFQGEENLKKVKDFFENKGFTTKIKKIEKVVYTDDSLIVYDFNEDNSENDKKRVFKLSKNKPKRMAYSFEKLGEVAKKYSKFID